MSQLTRSNSDVFFVDLVMFRYWRPGIREEIIIIIIIINYYSKRLLTSHCCRDQLFTIKFNVMRLHVNGATCEDENIAGRELLSFPGATKPVGRWLSNMVTERGWVIVSFSRAGNTQQ